MYSGLLVGCWIMGSFSSPPPLVKDGDLIAVVQHMILARVAETVRVTQVKRHATEDERHEDKWGNAEADTAADLGGRHQLKAVMDVRRTLLQVRTQVCFFSRYFALAFWDSGSGTLRDFLMGGHDPFGAMGGTPVAHWKGYSTSGSRTQPYFHFFCSYNRRN